VVQFPVKHWIEHDNLTTPSNSIFLSALLNHTLR